MNQIVNELIKLIAKAEESKLKISKERDKLREIYSTIETLVESVDNGLDHIETGILDIRQGIDSLSEHL